MPARGALLVTTLFLTACGGGTDVATPDVTTSDTTVLEDTTPGDTTEPAPGDTAETAPEDTWTAPLPDGDAPPTPGDVGGVSDTLSDDDSACDLSISPPPTGPVTPPPVTDEDAPTGTVAGRLVHPDGSPAVALRMLACTASICYWDETDEDGRFEVSDLTLEPLKMQTADPEGTHLNLLFSHLLETEDVSELPFDVIVPLRNGEEIVPWEQGGGTITIGDGQLDLTTETGAVSYLVGTKDKGLRAMRIEGADLPPYDWAPWAGSEAETFAFVINPLSVTADPGATFTVRGVTVDPCSVYRVWSVNSKNGSLDYAGTATVVESDSGTTLVSSADTTLHELTTIIFSPVVY